MKNFHVTFKSRPGTDRPPEVDNFHYEECPFPVLNGTDGQLIVRSLFLSIDPALRCRMNESTGVAYMAPWVLSETITGLGGVGEIQESNHPDYNVGDLVQGALSWPWKTYFLWNSTDSMELKKIDRGLVGDHPSLIISLLGLTGLTSLLGIQEHGQITPGGNDTVVVSGAAGACGSLAGQIARLLGAANVVGICGSDEKCRYLKEELMFDSAINYKSEDVLKRLSQSCPNGVQVYFDNVGGEISSSVISQMTKDSRVILCGQISTYNSKLPYPPPITKELQDIISQRNIQRERFLVLNYPEKFESGLQQLAAWYTQGKIKVRETMTEGLENAGKAFVSMMTGGNIGKQIVKVMDVQG